MGLREDSVACKYCTYYHIETKECDRMEQYGGRERRSPTYCCAHFMLPPVLFFARNSKRSDGSLILDLSDVPEKEQRLVQMEKAVQRESQKGCYIATAIYGSYDCPSVWVLRRYRDDVLSNTRLGRMFIRVYYAVSPKIVRLFGSSRWFSSFWKARLDKMVQRLKTVGFQDSPYKDKES